MTSQCFTGGMVPESAISVQHDANDSGAPITKSPLAGKAAGKFYEGNSVSPTFCGQNAREDVLSEFLREKYARARG